MAKHRVAIVGAFVLAGLLLFSVGLFLIGDRRMMFSKTFEVYTEFAQIAGLQAGAIVRVAGMDAGEVETIHVPTSPSGKFRVKMRVRDDLRPLLRLDSIASIQNDGLVGNKFLQVEPGTDQAPTVPDRGTIKSREPFDLATMLQKMNDSIDLVTTTITDVKTGLDEALLAVSSTAKDAQLLIKDIGSEIRAITTSGQKVAADLQVITSGVRQGRGTIGKLVTDDTLYTKITGIADQADKVIANLRVASEDAKAAIADFRGEKGPMKGITGDLQQSLASARETLADLAESSEALKRSFFFKGFFNKRGFFDLDDVTVDQYRQGALETNERRVLRVWLASGVLYEKNADGKEQLTDSGRQRLDSAMGAFLKYPRNTPFVVEGYAGGITSDERFVASRQRAQLVRDYLLSKFPLDPSYVAVMPLGREAPGSPAGEQWDGVALAVFVQTKSP
ncbi:MAG TPA: MlaD family protein [Vicinamibacterales bacterium]|nr:MlaD family protein [Vicinamibacterales bacterium]